MIARDPRIELGVAIFGAIRKAEEYIPEAHGAPWGTQIGWLAPIRIRPALTKVLENPFGAHHFNGMLRQSDLYQALPANSKI